MRIEVKQLTTVQLAAMGVKMWPVWEKEPSTFDWFYQEQEQCLFIAGEAEVTLADGTKVHFGMGDFVVFPKGLRCVWRVIKPVKKHYKFG